MLSWVGSVVAWIVLLVLSGVLLAAIAVPRLFGASPYVVLSSSMEPRLPPGTLLIVRPVPVDQLGIGDVITYQLRSGRPEVVTHRITTVSYGADGELTFRTRGDHNPADDVDPVRGVQVRGAVWYSLPWVGYPVFWLGGRVRPAITGVAVLGLVGYAAWLFVSGLRDRRRNPSGQRTAVS